MDDETEIEAEDDDATTDFVGVDTAPDHRRDEPRFRGGPRRRARRHAPRIAGPDGGGGA